MRVSPTAFFCLLRAVSVSMSISVSLARRPFRAHSATSAFLSRVQPLGGVLSSRGRQGPARSSVRGVFGSAPDKKETAVASSSQRDVLSLYTMNSATEIPMSPAVSKGISVKAAPAGCSHLTWQGDLLLLPMMAESGDPSEIRFPWGDMDQKSGGLLMDLLEREKKNSAPPPAPEDSTKSKTFCLPQGNVVSVRTERGSSDPKDRVTVGIFGASDTQKEGGKGYSEVFAGLGKSLAEAAKKEKAETVAVSLPVPKGISEKETSQIVQTFAENFLLALCEDRRFLFGERADAPRCPLKSLEIWLPEGGGSGDTISAPASRAAAVADGVQVARELVNAPPNVCNPQSLAAYAESLAKENPDVMNVKIMDENQIEEMKMGAYMGVAQGSVYPPRLIHLTYKPPSASGGEKKVALVGKGLTFDSGGYNIKAGGGSMIELMKFDMGGAAAVLGTAKALTQLKPEGVEVHIIIAACENMISQTAMRPGDILKAANGKTIEVINTDAEGRLTLADALWYAQEQKPEAIVDIATLTGACMVALGKKYGGLMTPDENMATDLLNAAGTRNELFWRLPMATGEYKELMKSEAANLRNVGTKPYGGAITAAIFLQEFVSDKVPWAHLDIAGPVWDDKTNSPSGFGVRTLVEWVTQK
uniref:leucyl aminopeptidase n=1 Tax=Chromera velia CCMP2878 TaxID=1169474 RepID=A0A0G4HSK7_9ALVE|eukprot:Cvel_8255.t1-p1 / transcript=Cvel_8255.t1 / gene=Cvel_8255 / organism=Chromera_velia_CCMP2878 / gene_product=Leucine aminopeptidase 3, chloroplastic, putative / transcript_product=Leucine aminopeptidase 3, chloroplastic, putative / location=Cvel_scaffold452:2784-10403(-) / protein_length=644 / sequence_SO=supercontig / SO=protein_coding / is_pseudo=false